MINTPYEINRKKYSSKNKEKKKTSREETLPTDMFLILAFLSHNVQFSFFFPFFFFFKLSGTFT